MYGKSRIKMAICDYCTIAYQNVNIHQQWSGRACKVTPHFKLAVDRRSVVIRGCQISRRYIQGGYGAGASLYNIEIRTSIIRAGHGLIALSAALACSGAVVSGTPGLDHKARVSS